MTKRASSGATSITVTSDSDGRVAATLTLGYQEGNSTNVVTVGRFLRARELR